MALVAADETIFDDGMRREMVLTVSSSAVRSRLANTPMEVIRKASRQYAASINRNTYDTDANTEANKDVDGSRIIGIV